MSKPKPPPFVYQAQVLSVHDGDTLTALADLGMGVSMKVVSRLHGIDTPEIMGQTEWEKAAALKARDRLRDLVLSKEVTLHSLSEPDKYGRLLCRVWVGDCDVNQILLDEGLARSYDGGKKLPWVPPVAT